MPKFVKNDPRNVSTYVNLKSYTGVDNFHQDASNEKRIKVRVWDPTLFEHKHAEPSGKAVV